MSRMLSLGLSIMLAASFTACERRPEVAAGNDPAADYQPAPAPPPETSAGAPAINDEIVGTLRSIDLKNKSVMVRVENGMEQTFKFDDETSVVGMSLDRAKARNTDGDNAGRMKQLAGKPGSEVSIRWRDENGQKMATSIDVIHLTTKKRYR